MPPGAVKHLPPGAPGPGRVFRSRQGIDSTPKVLSVNPIQGRVDGGLSVTIKGAQFRYATDGTPPTVLFGSTPATNVVVVDQYTITCDTPLVVDDGLVDIIIIQGPQSAVLTNGFTYVKTSVQRLTPNYGPLAGGTEVKITGSNFVTGTTVSFGGNIAPSVTVFDSRNMVVVTPNHAIGYVDVVFTEPLGAVTTVRNGFQYTLLNRGQDIRRFPAITIRDVLNQSPNECSFTIDGKSHKPVTGEKIEITDDNDGGRLLYAGTVIRVDQVYEEITTQLAWRVTCIDFTWLLNRRRPVGYYENISASDVVKDLVGTFAPGFTTAFVQEKLAPVTIALDGTKDFITVLNDIASQIGGGHWYVDYTQDVHFFHIMPQSLVDPNTDFDFDGDVMDNSATAFAAPTVAAAGNIPSAFYYQLAFYFFQYTFVYDNGVESSYSLSTPPVPLNGTQIVNFTNIPTGAPVDGHVVVKRRIYYASLSCTEGSYNLRNRRRYCELNDNVTTAFQSWFGHVGANVGTVLAPLKDPVRNFVVTPPPFGTDQPIGAEFLGRRENDIYLAGNPQPEITFATGGPQPYTAGTYIFSVSNIYEDLTESLPSVDSNEVTTENLTWGSRLNPSKASFKVRISGIPIGQPLNGLNVIARRIYARAVSVNQEDSKWTQGASGSWWLVPNNTAISADVCPSTAWQVTQVPHLMPGAPGTQPPVDQPLGGQGGVASLWPHIDGPDLESTLPKPDDIDNFNTSLLREPPFTSTNDLSQVRNRVYVRGAGTTVSGDAPAGSTAVFLADLSMFNPAGGQAYVNGRVLDYVGLDALSGPGTLFFAAALSKGLKDGDVICYQLRADDRVSQEAIGKVELDVNGLPTDGIHEYTINDPSLQTPLQVYMRAYAELELFSRPAVEINYATRDPKTRSGAIVNVNLTNPPCVGSFLIQDVTIDQIHDENDTELFPRYTVRASSVKFDLNDLLLKIVTTGENTAASVAGLVRAAQSDSGADDDRIGICYFTNANPATFQTRGIGMSNLANSGTAPVMDSASTEGNYQFNANRPDSRWLSCVTTTAASNTSGLVGADVMYVEENFRSSFHVKTDRTLTNLILWVGFVVSGVGIPTSNTGTNIKILAFRYNPATDGGWVGVLQQIGIGHPQTVTDVIASVTADTEYILQIDTDGGPQSSACSVTFRVNGKNPVTVNYADTITTSDANMPIVNSATAQGLVPMIGVTNTLTGAVKKLKWRYMSMSKR